MAGAELADGPVVPARQAILDLIEAVGSADGERIEECTRALGSLKWFLAPLSWAAGIVVLLVRGARLLIANWRLSLIQLIPAAWVWLAMWDLRWHVFGDEGFQTIGLIKMLALYVGSVALTVAAFWCNTVFAFAIDGPPPPRIRPAITKTRAVSKIWLAAGLAIGVPLATAGFLSPRLGHVWFAILLSLAIVVMLISFVAVPARIIGAAPQKLTTKERIGSIAVSGTLSAVAMTPGFVIARIGIVFLGLPRTHLLGFVLLTGGAGLYAAGMSTVKAVKLSVKLVGDQREPTSSVAVSRDG
jgi:hypothetical protein